MNKPTESHVVYHHSGKVMKEFDNKNDAVNHADKLNRNVEDDTDTDGEGITYKVGKRRGNSSFVSNEQTINLIDAISSGDTIASAQAFNDALMSRISDKINIRKQEVAQSMFKESKGYMVAYDNDDAKRHFIDHIQDHSGLSDNNPKMRDLQRELSSVDMKKKHQVVNAAIKAGIDKRHAEKAHDAILFESIDLNESKKKIGEYAHGANITRVYKLTGEHDEGDPYVVHLHKNGKHYEPADYFTNDIEDAHGTAKHMVKESINESNTGIFARAEAEHLYLASAATKQYAKSYEPKKEEEKTAHDKAFREMNLHKHAAEANATAIAHINIGSPDAAHYSRQALDATRATKSTK